MESPNYSSPKCQNQLQVMSWGVFNSARIGLNDRQVEGIWVWESGNQLSTEVAKHWHKWTSSQQWTEPNNHGGKEHCAQIDGSELYDGECNNKVPFVCQKRSEAGMGN